MSTTVTELQRVLNEIAPLKLQEKWDNCGMQIDMGREHVNRILVSLEITQEVVREAIAEDVDFIVTHHPLLFHGIKKIEKNNPMGAYLIDLIFTGISVYSAHTSFDAAKGGNNDDLAAKLGLTDVVSLPIGSELEEAAMMRIGYLPEAVELKEFAFELDLKLDNPGGIKVAGDPQRRIQKVGLCTGGAGEFYTAALLEGCDVYISGDVKHHEAQLAKENGMALIDAGHFGTEQIFVENMAKQLRLKTMGKVEVMESQVNVNPYDFVL